MKNITDFRFDQIKITPQTKMIAGGVLGATVLGLAVGALWSPQRRSNIVTYVRGVFGRNGTSEKTESAAKRRK